MNLCYLTSQNLSRVGKNQLVRYLCAGKTIYDYTAGILWEVGFIVKKIFFKSGLWKGNMPYIQYG